MLNRAGISGMKLLRGVPVGGICWSLLIPCCPDEAYTDTYMGYDSGVRWKDLLMFHFVTSAMLRSSCVRFYGQH